MPHGELRTPRKRAKRPRTPRLAALRLLGGIAVLALFATVVVGGASVFGYRAGGPLVELALDVETPDLDAAATAPPSQTTVVVAADGTVVGTFRPEELHVPLEPEQVPDVVAAAVVAAEDDAFWSHPGVDVQGAVRAALQNAQSGAIDQGGSTITQQLAKNLFTDGERTFQRKLDELRLSVALERDYEKDEILAAYLNTTYFGEGAVGVGAAARTYFRKPVGELSLSEAALLAGLIPAPSSWNPRVDPERAEVRRRYVLDRLEETRTVPLAEIESARAEAPAVHPAQNEPARYPYFLDYVRRWLLSEGGFAADDVFRGGMIVETTLDPRVQDASIAAVRGHLAHPHHPEAAVVVLDPAGGQVRALVGGRDWERSQVNLALGRFRGTVGRQPGSSFKPVVLAAALENGRSLQDRIGAPAEYQPEGASKPVGNYTRRGYGTMTIAQATARSINTSFVMLTEELGPDRVAHLARRLGLDIPDPAIVGPSIGIGAYEVSPLGMAQAYAAFDRDGRRVVGTPVTRVLDRRSGDVLLEAPWRVDGEQIVAPATARLVTSALEGVVRNGTGTRARLDRPAAGKTGTTDDYTNAWFVGYTPQLVASVWVGFPEGAIPMRGIGPFRAVTGGSIPAAIWRDVMATAHANLAPVPFPPAPDRPRSTTTTAAAPAPPRPATTAAPAPAPTTTTTAAPSTTTTTTTTAPPPTTTTTTAPTTTTTEPEPTTTTTTEPEPTTTTTEPESTTTTSSTSTTTTVPDEE